MPSLQSDSIESEIAAFLREYHQALRDQGYHPSTTSDTNTAIILQKMAVIDIICATPKDAKKIRTLAESLLGYGPTHLRSENHIAILFATDTPFPDNTNIQTEDTHIAILGETHPFTLDGEWEGNVGPGCHNAITADELRTVTWEQATAFLDAAAMILDTEGPTSKAARESNTHTELRRMITSGTTGLYYTDPTPPLTQNDTAPTGLYYTDPTPRLTLDAMPTSISRVLRNQSLSDLGLYNTGMIPRDDNTGIIQTPFGPAELQASLAAGHVQAPQGRRLGDSLPLDEVGEEGHDVLGSEEECDVGSEEGDVGTSDLGSSGLQDGDVGGWGSDQVNGMRSAPEAPVRAPEGRDVASRFEEDAKPVEEKVKGRPPRVPGLVLAHGQPTWWLMQLWDNGKGTAGRSRYKVTIYADSRPNPPRGKYKEDTAYSYPVPSHVFKKKVGEMLTKGKLTTEQATFATELADGLRHPDDIIGFLHVIGGKAGYAYNYDQFVIIHVRPENTRMMLIMDSELTEAWKVMKGVKTKIGDKGQTGPDWRGYYDPERE